jgi:tetratricopeptide (TPR) repeat protein
VISILLALAAQAGVPTEDAQFRSCTALVKSDARAAVKMASDWRLQGGSLPARLCLGLAYVELQSWEPAAVAFELGAKEAETARDPRRADFWVQSGNAWLAAEQPDKARAAFDAALATDNLTQEMRGEVHLDRARAQVALNDLGGARNDVNRGLELVGRDPFAWYLSSALSLREGNMAKAAADIGKAVELAPDDADVLLQAGNVAGTTGDSEGARDYYGKVIRIAPRSDAARAAEQALAQARAEPEEAEEE